MSANLEGRVEALERRLAEMAGIEQCDECGGPIPYAARGVFERIHPDGSFERLYESCPGCGQPVSSDGRGAGKPSRGGRSVVETVVFSDYAGPG